MNKKVPLLWILGLVLIGCSESDRINSDSIESYRKSIVSITKGMSQDERSSFMDDVALLNREHGGFKSTVDDPDLRFLAYVNGKSVSDVISDSLEIKRQDKIATIKSDISLGGQRVAQLKASIAAKLEEIESLERSISAAKIKEESDKAGAVKAKEILDKLEVTGIEVYRPPVHPLLGTLGNGRVDFKIVNETDYQVEVENVTIKSGDTTIVLAGGFGCKGLANDLLGFSGKISPKSERKIQCEIANIEDIGNSGTVEISGGSVLGIGEYNPKSKSPLSMSNLGGFLTQGNKTRFEEAQAELRKMETILSVLQTRMANSCNELANFGESDFPCRP